MKIEIRIPDFIYNQMIKDLNHQPCQFAKERVGFLFTRTGIIDDDRIVLAIKYMVLDDSDYVQDDLVGARIGSKTIRSVMQNILDNNFGVFHVHLHNSDETLRFSKRDNIELPKLIPSFQAVGKQQVHGLLLLNQLSAIARVWLPSSNEGKAASRISIVGTPFTVWKSRELK
jgi:hypothetical protein